MDIIFNFFFHSHVSNPFFPASQQILRRFIDISYTITTLIFNNKFHNDFEANYFVIIIVLLADEKYWTV